MMMKRKKTTNANNPTKQDMNHLMKIRGGAKRNQTHTIKTIPGNPQKKEVMHHFLIITFHK